MTPRANECCQIAGHFRRLPHLPLTIEIDAGNPTSIIAKDDAVRIEHGDDAHDDSRTQGNRFWRGCGDSIDEAIHHPARVGLARMHARRDYNDAPRRYFSCACREVGHRKQIARVPTACPTERLAM
eukprot:scaffold106646_cov31-Tisochrysis_lutea.AAC.5